MADLPRAAFLSDRVVRVAAVMLPAGVRDRYEREFLSELFGRSTWQRTGYALDILIHTAGLRTATRTQASPSELTVTDQPHPPLTCRLRVHHHWVTNTTPDGVRYQQCCRCGKDRTGFDDNDKTIGEKSAGAAITGLTGFGTGG